MSRNQRRLFFLSIAVLLGIAAWWAFFQPRAFFQLYDRRGESVILEYYTIQNDGSFNLDAIAVAGYGAGIPAEMDVPTRVEDGLVWMEGINSRFEELKWLTSSVYMKGLTLNGTEIFDFRALPNASLIRGQMITKRGYLSID